MVEQIIKLINRNGETISIYFILIIIVANSLLVFHHINVVAENLRIQDQVLTVNKRIESINKYMSKADLSLHGFIIIQDEKSLKPFREAIDDYKNSFDELKSVLSKQGFDKSKVEQAARAVDQYMKLIQQMAQMCTVGDVDEAVTILKSGQGKEVRMIYSNFEQASLKFENGLSEQANKEFKTMKVRMLISQLLLLIIAIPLIIIAIRDIKKNRKVRSGILKNLSQANKNYIFNSDKENEKENIERAIGDLTMNLKKISGFISSITNGNHDILWDGLTKENAPLNKNNIAGELINMRDQMKRVKSEDEIRIWITQGLSNFGEIVQSNQNDFKVLAEKLITNIVKYLNVQQGGLFFVNDEKGGEEIFLELIGCYAFDRIKSITKKIEPGQGIVGQCFLERKTIYMTKVPQEFVNITSGLGDAPPDSILIVPLKLNDKIEGVIELASLKPFQKHEIEFVEKLGETIASAITTVKTSEDTKYLLEQSQQQAEELRTQEEEMRQNMEELQATQEQLERSNTENVEKNLQLEAQMSVINVASLVSKTDRKGIITYANDIFCDVAGYTHEELIGQNHNMIRHPDMTKAAFKDLWRTIGSGKVWSGKVKNKAKDGSYYWVDATIGPIIGEDGKPKEYIGVRYLISDYIDDQQLVKLIHEKYPDKDI